MKDPIILANLALLCLIRADQAPHQRGLFIFIGTLTSIAAFSLSLRYLHTHLKSR